MSGAPVSGAPGPGPVPGWWTGLCAELAPLLPGLRVAVYASGGAPYHHAALVALWGGIPVPLSAGAILSGALNAFDVLIVPGGGLTGMSGLLHPLEQTGAVLIRAWVEAGGMYIGSCAGAYLPAHWPEGFARQHAAQAALQLLQVELANPADGPGLGGLDSPGVGVVQVEVQAPDHWLSAGLPRRFPAVHYNGPCFRPPAGWGITRLAGSGRDFTPWERMVPGIAPEGDGPAEPALLVDTLVGEGASNVVAADLGRGTVVLFGSHPEFGFDALQLGWGVAASLFGNALAHQARRVGAADRPGDVWPTGAGRAGPPPAPGSPDPHAPDLGRLAARFSEAASRLGAYRPEVPTLQDAPGFLGRPATRLFPEALQQASLTCQRVARSLLALARASPVPDRLRCWLDCPPATDQDYGFVGLIQLADRLHNLIGQAERAGPPPAVRSPYGDWDRHPYHLLASSYLSASGLTASAALATGTLIRLWTADLPMPFPLFCTPERGVPEAHP